MRTALDSLRFPSVCARTALFAAACLAAFSGLARAQLDLQSWTLVDPYNRWSKNHPTPTSCRMDETATSSSVGPGWVLSPFTLPATASFEVTVKPLANGDDDLIGVAFSWQSNTQHLLLDWKKNTQAFNWGDPVAINDDTAEAGLKLKKIAGSFTRDGLWGGTDGLGVTTLAGPTGTGWVDDVARTFRFMITPGRVVIERDGVQVFDLTDPAVTAGRIAVYSFSQDDVIFSNVSIAPGGPFVYCTAGTSTHGCTPSISAVGLPSLGASSGYTLSITGVEGQKQGLIFYGVSGAAINAWGTGGTSYLCVKSPTQRMSAQSSGGTNAACNGLLSEDWLAFLAANPTSLGAPFSPGTPINAQGWYRDPSAVKTTNLSNALEFVLVP